MKSGAQRYQRPLMSHWVNNTCDVTNWTPWATQLGFGLDSPTIQNLASKKLESMGYPTVKPHILCKFYLFNFYSKNYLYCLQFVNLK